MFKKYIEFMQLLKSLPSRDQLNIIIRPKIPKEKEQLDSLSLLEKHSPNGEYIYFLRDRSISTQNLISWSDLVVASNGSGVIAEACNLGKQSCYILLY